MSGQTTCAQCGAEWTQLTYFPSLLGWFCTGQDGAGCYARKLAQESAR
jgi:hypothetical protein